MFRSAILAVLLLASCPGQERSIFLDKTTSPGRRIALVIGNNAYPSAPLTAAVNDATAMSKALRELGFQVTIATDTDLRHLESAINQFVATISTNDVALFYYAGHGFQIEGENYLVPVDFNAQDEADAKYVAYSASRLTDRMENTGARLKIIILDACRNNPFRSARALGRGLAQMNAGRGTFIALATAPGKVAAEDMASGSGVFTRYLVEELRVPGLTLNEVFDRVRLRVDESSHGRQLPWTSSSVIGQFRFRNGGGYHPFAEGADEFNEGERLYRAKDYTGALAHFQRAAEAGNGTAMAYIGFLYADGNGVPKDEAAAIGWFERGIQATSLTAHVALGDMYAAGRGVPKDDVMAVQWYRKAAMQGSPGGMVKLGDAYHNGRGVTRDDNEAANWYKRAASLGFRPAETKLQQMGLQSSTGR